MAAKRSKKPAKASSEKGYYTPPTAIDKIRHKLADGVPTDELLHYMHGRDKLPADVKSIAEAAEKFQQVRTLLAEINKSKAIDQVHTLANADVDGVRRLTNGDVDTVIAEFMRSARKALVLKTMKGLD